MDHRYNNNNKTKKKKASQSRASPKVPPVRHRPDRGEEETTVSSSSQYSRANNKKWKPPAPLADDRSLFSTGSMESGVVAILEERIQKHRQKKAPPPPEQNSAPEHPLISTATVGSMESGVVDFLEERIAGHRKKNSDLSAKQQARAAARTESSSGIQRVPSTDNHSKKERSSANQRAMTTQTLVSGDESQSITSTNTNGTSKSRAMTRLQRLQEEVAAKRRGRAPSTSTPVKKPTAPVVGSPTSGFTAVKQLNRMEADLAAKERGRTTTRARANQVSPVKPAVRRLDRLEAEIAEKAQAGKPSATRSSPAKNGPGTIEAGAREATKKKRKPTTEGVAVGAAAISRGSTTHGKKQDGVSSKIHAYPNNVCRGGDDEEEVFVDIALPSGNNDGDDNRSKPDASGLAVAVAVDENEDAFIPSAVEYDPEAKPPVYKNQRCRVYGILGCIVVVIIAACSIGVLAALAESNNENNPAWMPTESPTCARCTMDFIERLELEVGSEKLMDPTSAEYMAKEWILHEDALQLDPANETFVQRFLMATFYFDTHRIADWRSCNRRTSEDESDLCDFVKVTAIEPELKFKTVPSNRWLSPISECNWAGVACEASRVVRNIDLHGQGIQGTFPSSFTLLEGIQLVSFSMNNFTGTLPSDLGRMRHLIYVEMHRNQFTGTIPTGWSGARNLQLLNLAENQLTGQLPASLGNLRNIKGLYINNNKLSGSLPPELSNARSLGYIRFQRNSFQGTIPSEFGNMRLNEVWLHNNPNLTGTIPTEFGKLSNYMTDLRLAETSMTGTIPEALFEISLLRRLDLKGSEFSGTISPNITKLESMEILRLGYNEFTGELPDSWGAMTNLMQLELRGNNLTGSIPSSICDLREDHNLANLFTPCGGIACECCDVC